MIRCCYKCENRKIGCHAYCASYREEKQETDQQNKEINKRKKLDGAYYESVIRCENRIKKRKNKR